MKVFRQAKWIGREDLCMVDWRRPTVPAPVFKRTFELKSAKPGAVAFISGLGFFELYINGQKVGDEVLEPTVTCYDKRWRYKQYPIGRYLRPGDNTVAVMLGNGWYNCQTPDVWHFDKATWRDYPKMIFEIQDGQETLLFSDSSWSVISGPVLFDSLRGGEVYDARREVDLASPCASVACPRQYSTIAGQWPAPYDALEQEWRKALVVAGPGGLPEEELIPPCRVCKTIPAKRISESPLLFDLNANISGWTAISVRGECGAKITLRYGERLSADRKHIDNTLIRGLVLDDTFQTDVYILKGGSPEEWEPRFTYHGFRYIEVEIEGNAELKRIEGRFVHTDFERHGEIVTSDPRLNRLLHKGERSLLSNMVGIPTDCPHREKNGWTSEAQLAFEFAMYNFDVESFFAAFEDTAGDTQRPDGRFPGMAPTSGWGYNWGNGPAWDSAFFTFPYQLYLHTNKTDIIQRHFPAMTRYLEFCAGIEEDGILRYGLGDWVAPQKEVVNPEAVSTAYYYYCLSVAKDCAKIIGNYGWEMDCAERMDRVGKAFQQKYYLGNGKYDSPNSTGFALPLYFNLVPDAERKAVAKELCNIIRKNSGRVDYGTIGSRVVPRALLEAGYPDEAYLLMTQPEYPGYQYWDSCLDYDTFPETWSGLDASLNHAAFVDILACIFRYFAGFRHSTIFPGKKHLDIVPQIPRGLAGLSAKYLGYHVVWRNQDDEITFSVHVPDGATARMILPGGIQKDLAAGDTVVAFTLPAADFVG